MRMSSDAVGQDGYHLLREMGSIGAANACAALTRLTGKTVRTIKCEAIALDVENASRVLGAPDKVSVATATNVEAELSGIMLFIMGEEFAARLLEAIWDQPFSLPLSLEREDVIAIKQVSNAVCAFYIAPLGEMLGMSAKLSPANLYCDNARALMNLRCVRMSGRRKGLIYIENSFAFENTLFVNHLLFLPRRDSLETLLRISQG